MKADRPSQATLRPRRIETNSRSGIFYPGHWRKDSSESWLRCVGVVYSRPFSFGNQKCLWLVNSGKLVPEEEEQTDLDTCHGHGDTNGCKKSLQAIAGVGLGRARAIRSCGVEGGHAVRKE